MIIRPTPIVGVHVVDIEPANDDRGFFARLWCEETFRAAGLDTRISQCSISYNRQARTLRGLHYQAAPCEETKWVRCQGGAVFDVMVDLRPETTSFRSWFGVELSDENHRMVYIPPGVAHGFITLADESIVHYQIGGQFVPASGRGVRWNDPAFAIDWPHEPLVIAERDRQYPDFRP